MHASRSTQAKHLRFLGFRIKRSLLLGGGGIALGLALLPALALLLLAWDEAEDRQRLADASSALPANGDALPNVTETPVGEEADAPSLPETDSVTPGLRKILDAHVKAMGGWANWSRVESIRLAGTIERDGETVDFCIIKKRPDQIRATLTLPMPGNDEDKLQVIRAHDGTHAWTATRLAGAEHLEKKDLDESAANELLADAGVLPKLIGLWQARAQLTLQEPTTIGGKPVFVISAQPNYRDIHYTFYISTETYLTLQYQIKDRSGVTTTRISNYRKEKGLLIPSFTLIEADKTGKSLMSTDSIEVGVGIYKEYFDPAEHLARANL